MRERRGKEESLQNGELKEGRTNEKRTEKMGAKEGGKGRVPLMYLPAGQAM